MAIPVLTTSGPIASMRRSVGRQLSRTVGPPHRAGSRLRRLRRGRPLGAARQRRADLAVLPRQRGHRSAAGGGAGHRAGRRCRADDARGPGPGDAPGAACRASARCRRADGGALDRATLVPLQPLGVAAGGGRGHRLPGGQLRADVAPVPDRPGLDRGAGRHHRQGRRHDRGCPAIDGPRARRLSRHRWHRRGGADRRAVVRHASTERQGHLRRAGAGDGRRGRRSPLGSRQCAVRRPAARDGGGAAEAQRRVAARWCHAAARERGLERPLGSRPAARPPSCPPSVRST